MQSQSLFRVAGFLLIMLCSSLFAQDRCAWDTIPQLDNSHFLPSDSWCDACCANGLANHAFCSTCCGSGSEYYANLTCISRSNQYCHLPQHGSRSTASCCGTDAQASCVGIPLALITKSAASMQAKTINCTTHAQAKHYCMRGYNYENGLCVWPIRAGKPTLYCQVAKQLLDNDLPRCYDPKQWEGNQPQALTHANRSACPYDAEGNVVGSSSEKHSQTEAQQTTAQESDRQKERGEARRINRRYHRRRDYYDQE